MFHSEDLQLMPTRKSTVLTDGSASLFHFMASDAVQSADAPPVLLVPSMINRWYVLDLTPGASVAEAFVNGGFDTWLLDWGVPEEHDRYFTWADALKRLDRMVRRVRRETGAEKVTVLGYSMGATLAAVHAALHPELYAGFVNVAGPIDFTDAGIPGRMTDARWFNAQLIAEAGNVSQHQMQAGFFMLRPTQELLMQVNAAHRAHDAAYQRSHRAISAWAADYIPFPGATYATYISELYQQNNLVHGRHQVLGRRVDLKAITCPVLTVTAEHDTICPPRASVALNDAVGATHKTLLPVPGGHVSAVAGSQSSHTLYPALIEWASRT